MKSTWILQFEQKSKIPSLFVLARGPEGQVCQQDSPLNLLRYHQHTHPKFAHKIPSTAELAVIHHDQLFVIMVWWSLLVLLRIPYLKSFLYPSFLASPLIMTMTIDHGIRLVITRCENVSHSTNHPKYLGNMFKATSQSLTMTYPLPQRASESFSLANHKGWWSPGHHQLLEWDDSHEDLIIVHSIGCLMTSLAKLGRWKMPPSWLLVAYTTLAVGWLVLSVVFSPDTDNRILDTVTGPEKLTVPNAFLIVYLTCTIHPFNTNLSCPRWFQKSASAAAYLKVVLTV